MRKIPSRAPTLASCALAGRAVASPRVRRAVASLLAACAVVFTLAACAASGGRGTEPARSPEPGEVAAGVQVWNLSSRERRVEVRLMGPGGETSFELEVEACDFSAVHDDAEARRALVLEPGRHVLTARSGGAAVQREILVGESTWVILQLVGEAEIAVLLDTGPRLLE